MKKIGLGLEVKKNGKKVLCWLFLVGCSFVFGLVFECKFVCVIVYMFMFVFVFVLVYM